jgi:hypothetical protein
MILGPSSSRAAVPRTLSISYTPSHNSRLAARPALRVRSSLMKGDGKVTHRRPKQPRFTRGPGKDSIPDMAQVGTVSALGETHKAARKSSRPHDNHVKPLAVWPKKHKRQIPRLDRRSIEWKLMERVRSDLTEHVGGNPSATQKAMIEMAAWLSLKLELLDREITIGKQFNDYHTNVYLSWTNSLSRLLARLGLEPKRRSRNFEDFLDAAQ